MKYNIELLAPAGSKEVLSAAIGEGADSIYLGLKDFNARARAKNFNYKEFEACVDKLHAINKKVYVAVNTIFEEWEKSKIFNLIKYISLVKPDGVIVQDFGMIYLINKYFPTLKMHASTQMNVSSIKGINFLSKHGIKRAVLGRELSFEEIQNIRNSSRIEIEVFVHGALCVSVSGLCFFSSYLDGKSANRGYCSQPCRRLYKSDKSGGFFFSPNDLELIEHVPELIEAGVNSFKIEGRMKNEQYVASVVRAYRYVIDNFQNNKEESIKTAKEILAFDLARKKTKYYFRNDNNLDFISADQSSQTGLLLGEIKEVSSKNYEKTGLINSSFNLNDGDQLRFYSHKDKTKINFKAKIISKENDNIKLVIPNGYGLNDLIYLTSSKLLRVKYHQIIPKSLNKYKRHPGNLYVPEVEIKYNPEKQAKNFAEGIYLKINNLNHYFQAQTINPVKVILNLNNINYNSLFNLNEKIQIKKENIIIELMPSFFNREETNLETEVNELINAGYKHFIINNLGQIQLFKDKNVNLISGQYLYTFNSYSIKFLTESNINYFTSPLENNKQNLFLETKKFNNANWFVIIFGYPELFQITSDLRKNTHLKVSKTTMKIHIGSAQLKI